MEITLPVSIGEALDKLTILDIKIEKISDERKIDCQKEYIVLDSSLKNYREQYSYFYKLLREINLEIWNLQDKFHGKQISGEEAGILCKQILDENDRRFRVKAKLNTICSSNLREQKGYAKKRAFVYTHLGLGDMFWMNGAVRYLSTCYDELIVVCKEKYRENIALMYSDDPTIKLFCLPGEQLIPPFPAAKWFNTAEIMTMYACGYHIPNPRIYEFPFCFYDDMGLPREYMKQYFHTPTVSGSEELYKTISANQSSYVVIHQQSQNKTIGIWEKLYQEDPETLLLDLNVNHYPPGHRYYELAQLVLGKPLLHYKTLLENARELHMIESSVYCMASQLNLSKVSKKFCYEAFEESNLRLGVFETGTL
jgi:hypothetical protein